jgi:hypothetical protein
LGQRERASDDAKPSTIPEWPVYLGDIDEASKHAHAPARAQGIREDLVEVPRLLRYAD